VGIEHCALCGQQGACVQYTLLRRFPWHAAWYLRCLMQHILLPKMYYIFEGFQGI